MKHTYQWALLAGLLLVACSSEETATDPSSAGSEETENGITMSVEGFETDDATRTTLTHNGNKLEFAWSQGDKIGVFGPTLSQQLTVNMYSMGDIGDTKTAKFTSQDYQLVKDNSYIAYYPLSDNSTTTGNDIWVDYEGQTQNGNDNLEHLGKYDFIVSDQTTATATNTADFTLKHIGTVLCLKIKMPVAGSWSSLKLSTSSGSFTYEGTLDLYEKRINPQNCNTKQSVEMYFDNVTTTSSDNELTAWMMVAPFSMSGREINITVTGADGTKVTGSFTPSKDYVMGKVYRVSVTNTSYEESKYLGGPFKVSDYVSVTFAKGNLQYDIQNKKYQLAENQWTYLCKAIGKDYYNNYVKDYYTVEDDHITKTGNEDYPYILDLFGWGTGKCPTHANGDNTHYLGANCAWDDSHITGTSVQHFTKAQDWSAAAKADVPELDGSRTLTSGEWEYLLKNQWHATVGLTGDGISEKDGIYGLVVFPYHTSEATANSYLTDVEVAKDSPTSFRMWGSMTVEKLNKSGALFLPAAGDWYWQDGEMRTEGGLSNGYSGTQFYWSSTSNSTDLACGLYIMSSKSCGVGMSGRSSGNAVRLAKEVE